MSAPLPVPTPTKPRKRCAVYCRVSSDERLDQEFNSIDAQKEAGHAYVASQRAEGWIPGARFVANLAEADLEPHDEVIVYCDCPNEASAAILAKQLRARGFGRVRPLAGGFHAWMTEGHEVARGP